MTTFPEKLARGLLITLLAMCFCMVTLGGYVRLSGSGLSIPEWPIFTVAQTLDATGAVVSETKSVFPPTTPEGWEILRQIYLRDIPGAQEIAMGPFKRMFWIEWSHRGLAKLIGLVYLAALALVLLSPSLRPRLGKRIVAGFLLLISQAIIGGIVVWFHLSSVKVALHLSVAFLFTTLVVWMLMSLLRPSSNPDGAFITNPIFRLAVGIYALVLTQIFSGGLMAASYAGYQMKTWPKMGEYWVPPGLWDSSRGLYGNMTENMMVIQFTHRWFAIVVAAAVLLFCLRTLTVGVSPVARWALRALFGLVVLQVALGVLTLLAKAAGYNHLALTHQSVGLVLLLAVFVVVYETAYHRVTMEAELPDAAPAQAARRERVANA